MRRAVYPFLFFLCISNLLFSQSAEIREEMVSFRTYDFSDPDPVVNMNKIYPYFSYDGYETKPSQKEWKVITLENNFIKVMIAPEIGGKILGAIEKSTGKEFLYYNKVVKFRKIAMRGPWTSGGLEFNFGTIGHTPMVATPVDYTYRKNDDGSVSCFIGANDLGPRTYWTVEIRLPADEALFEIHTTWHNYSNLETSLYHWTNAAAAARNDLQFYYPGTKYIDHGGKDFPYPIDKNGIDISKYGNNTFGGNKSFHILGSYTDYFGGYYDDLDFGFVHWADYSMKPGKKLWMWSTSRQGAIWEDLLTDPDTGNGQYIEYQSGLLFNQAASNSSETPYNHLYFPPNGTETFSESFYPVKNIDGITYANESAALYLEEKENEMVLKINPVKPIKGELKIELDFIKVVSEQVELKPMQEYTLIFKKKPFKELEIKLGKDIHYWSRTEESKILERPMERLSSIEENTVYGQYKMGKELSNQRLYQNAEKAFNSSLKLDPNFVPSLEEKAEIMYRKMLYDSAIYFAKRAMEIDTYSPKANFIYGLCFSKKNDFYNAVDGFSIASKNEAFRSVSYRELAKIYIGKGDFQKGFDYAERSLDYNQSSITSQHIKLVALRKLGRIDEAKSFAELLLKENPLNHLVRIEGGILQGTDLKEMYQYIKNEFASETWLELAIAYYNLNLYEEGIQILNAGPKTVLNNIWLAYLNDIMWQPDYSAQPMNEALDASPELTFPFRSETLSALNYYKSTTNWKFKYYKGLLLWNTDQKDEAITIFSDLGNEPDYAPFYLTRVNLMEGSKDYNPESDINRSIELDPLFWRGYVAKINYLLEQNRITEALEVSEKANSNFGDNFYIDFEYAKILLFSGEYFKCVDILENTEILPNEGASEGRVVYRQACILGAVEKIKIGDYKSSLDFINKAKLWPENLGVGKPYSTDEAIEDYLEGYALSKLKMKKEANAIFDKILARDLEKVNFPSNYAYLLSLKAIGKDKKMEEILIEWTSQRNKGIEYIKAVLTKDREFVSKLEEEFNIVTPSLNRSFLNYQLIREMPFE